MKKSDETNDVLEKNVSTLLEAGGEAPRLPDVTRARIRAQLVAKHGKDVSRRRSPAIAVGFGLAATAAGALLVTRFSGSDKPAATEGESDGSTWVTDEGGKVTKLGPRHVRVEGAALLDVAPGNDKFVVDTARGTIEVLGTRFLVNADKDRTVAAVVRGQVKLASTDGNVTLHAGEQGVIELGRPPTRGPAPRLSHLVSWAEQARKKDEHAIRPLRNGTLFARDPNNPWIPESPLPIAKLGVDVVVEDQVARVAIDQTFHNPSPRTMEGMYRFAIPPDASLQRLAMYINGTLTESAVVERMQARRIYEDVVYRRLDPALLEWAGTGRLALKVYPLPAQEDKRLVLAYTQSLPKLYDDWTLTVPLPEVDLPVGELDFDVRIKGCANCEVTSTSHKVDVQRTGDDAIVAYKQTAARIGDSLVLHVRDKRKQAIVSSFADPKDNEAKFVLLRARPDLAGPRPEYRQRTWVILDDVSASRDATARKAQADLIDGFLRELDEEDRVAIVAFDVAARQKLAPTRVMAVDRKAVRAALNLEGGVGATDFGVALDAATKLLANVPPDDAMIVYLGDGVISSGARQLDVLRTRIAGKAHFVGVGVGDGPDTQTLEALAAGTGGYSTTIDLADDVGWRAFDLVAALHTPRVSGLQARLVDENGTLVPATVYIKTPQLADGEELELVAKLAGSAPPAHVELTGTLNGAPWQQKVAIAGGTSTNAGYLPRLWAQRHIAARLLAKHEPVVAPPCVAQPEPQARTTRNPRTPVASKADANVCKTEVEVRQERDEAIRKEIVGLGRKYFLLSRHTSLLVLENDEMYKKYEVTKGTGDTWAPYALPAKIKIVSSRPTGTPDDVASDAELVRRPMQIFYNPGYYDSGIVTLESGLEWGRRTRTASTGDGFIGTRGTMGLGRGPSPSLTPLAEKAADLDSSEQRKELKSDPVDRMAARADESARASDDKAKRDIVFADDISGGETLGHASGTGQGFGVGGGGNIPIAGKMGKKADSWHQTISYPQRLGYPTDIAYDDLTGFIPALMPDGSDSWRAELQMSAGGAKTHPIDDGARALLESARRALPSGVYRWDDREIAVDDARHIGWHRTTGADLAETASFDGTTLTRRYAELGIDVTRTFAEDDIALALGHLPIWIAEPAHYARWFEVRLKGLREVTLSRTIGKRTELAYTLEFDDKHRLVAIRDAKGADLVKITWNALAPTGARVLGSDITLGYNGQPIADAATWAHNGSAAGVAVELPAHLPAFWDAKLKSLSAGSAEWRHTQRQKLASLAAINDRPNLFATYEALRTNGGIELGDLVLASGGIATSTTDPQLAAALSPAIVAKSTVASYLRAARAYGQSPKSERMKAQVTTGFLGALWTVREMTALLVADKNTLAVDRLLSLGQRAFDLRLIGASATSNRYQMKPADIARAWDSVATGEYKNIARAQAAQLLAGRGQYDAAAERIAKLVAELDLDAAPPNLQQMQWQFQQSRRGQAGWQLVWAMWRDRVLAGNSYEHVMSLIPLANYHPLDTLAILSKAATLAGDDPERVVAVAQMAMNTGNAAFGQSLVEPLVKKHPTRELHQLVGGIALGQGKHAEALAHFEAAQDAGGDEAVALSTVRNELAQIITVARQVAVQSSGSARQQAVQRALAWGAKWRAIDPGNPAIDSQLGELLLAVGDKAEAWRQLSSVIERDPMSGDGYQTVANAFEAQGRVAEAVEYWHQGAMIDQTNPTPRLREAQALIALGRTAEGDAILTEIAGKKWHVRWESVAYQARNMIERTKQQQVPIDE